MPADGHSLGDSGLAHGLLTQLVSTRGLEPRFRLQTIEELVGIAWALGLQQHAVLEAVELHATRLRVGAAHPVRLIHRPAGNLLLIARGAARHGLTGGGPLT